MIARIEAIELQMVWEILSIFGGVKDGGDSDFGSLGLTASLMASALKTPWMPIPSA
jgi:hypothetical protein